MVPWRSSEATISTPVRGRSERHGERGARFGAGFLRRYSLGWRGRLLVLRGWRLRLLRRALRARRRLVARRAPFLGPGLRNLLRGCGRRRRSSLFGGAPAARPDVARRWASSRPGARGG